MPVYDSVDNILSSAKNLGVFRRFWSNNVGTCSAATTSCGSQSIKRLPGPITLPSSFGPGVNGIYFTRVEMATDRQTYTLAALEYNMGSLAVSTNTFTDGVSMPVKNVLGNSIQTAAEMTVVVATTALTATTPVLTITYTDQDGNTGNTATLTLPTNVSVNSGFLVHPHLANGDTGIRDITNVSISTGSAGVLGIFGLLILNTQSNGITFCPNRFGPTNQPYIPWIGEASERVAVYQGNTVNSQVSMVLTGVANY